MDMERAAPPILSGPVVQEERLPGVESGFTLDRGDSSRLGGQPVEPQAFRAALASLMAEDAPAAVRLSAAQRDRIMQHVRAFGQRVRAQRGGTEQGRGPQADRGRRGIERGVRPNREQGDRRGEQRREINDSRPAEPRATRPASRAASQPQDRARMMRGMADLQHRVWAELSEAQQKHVGKQLEAHRAERNEQREGQMRERYRKEYAERFEKSERRRSIGQDREGLDRDILEFIQELPEPARERLQRRLSQLSESRRIAYIERLQKMSSEEREQLAGRLSERRGRMRSDRESR